MAYVYRHIRLDKNEPFYIGIGNDLTYNRANTTSGRNPIWNKIVDKTEFEVEILLDGLTWDEACEKEIEFIALYGRKMDGGILSNITKGGEGKLGVVPKNAFQKGHTMSPLKGKRLSEELKEKLHGARRGIPSWNKGITPSKETVDKQMKTKIREGKILKGEKHPMFGKTHTDELKKKWSKERKGSIPWNVGRVGDKHPNSQAHRRKIVLQYDKNMKLINEYESLAMAATVTGFRAGSISKAILGLDRMKSHKGYVWRYKDVG